jgi:hypothetical protein
LNCQQREKRSPLCEVVGRRYRPFSVVRLTKPTVRIAVWIQLVSATHASVPFR